MPVDEDSTMMSTRESSHKTPNTSPVLNEASLECNNPYDRSIGELASKMINFVDFSQPKSLINVYEPALMQK